MKEGSSYLDSWRKKRGKHSIFERSFVKKYGSSCSLVPLVNLVSFLLFP